MPTVALLLAAELLFTPSAPGFAVGYHAERDGNMIVERVPAGENVQVWTRMLTTQRFAGVARKTDGNAFLQLMVEGLQADCPRARLSYRRATGRIAQMRVDCPLNPATGKPETFFAKAMPGIADMHVAQVAFRRVPTAADAAWAERYLAKVVVKR